MPDGPSELEAIAQAEMVAAAAAVVAADALTAGAAARAAAEAAEASAAPLALGAAGGSSEECTLSPEALAQLKAEALGDLYVFAKGVLGYSKLDPEVHEPLCRLLELYRGYDDTLLAPWSQYRKVLRDVLRRMRVPREQWDARIEDVRRHGLRRLAILLPRTWYKTTVVSIAYPLWRGVRDVNVRVLLAQNTSTNAVSKGMALAQQVDNNGLFRVLFSEVLPLPHDKWGAESRCLHRDAAYAEGTFEFVGTQSQTTSRHFNVVIEDDTVAPKKDKLGVESILPSQEDVAQAIGWHKLVLPLLNDIKEDQSLVVGTRWFDLDLLRWVMDNEKWYWVYQRGVREDEHGQPDPKGEIQYKARFDEAVLEELEAGLGPYMYSCLYLNIPVRSQDMLFKPEWFDAVYQTEPPRLAVFMTGDMAGDPMYTKGVPDYYALMITGKDLNSGIVYVLDYWRARCAPGAFVDEMFKKVQRWHPLLVGLQNLKPEQGLLPWIYERQKKSGEFFTLRLLSPHTHQSKVSYINALQAPFSAGVIKLRASMDELRSELLQHPLSKNDDLADTLAMQQELWPLTLSHKEEAQRLQSGVNSFEYVLEQAGKAQAAADAQRARGVDRPEAFWGRGVPDVARRIFGGAGGSFSLGQSVEEAEAAVGREVGTGEPKSS